ncbi:MAG: glycosyltransferase [Geitlerinemataceae cyanobacterium]
MAQTPNRTPERPSTTASQILVLTGMHRSGTSLMASLLQAMGVHVGDRLLAGDRTNAPGYFEDEDFLEFQRRVLTGCCDPDDGGWPDWGWTESESLDRRQFENYTTEARQLLAARARQGLSTWGWKDPRTSLMLDFWDGLLPEARYVLVYREPWDVVDSCVRLRSGVFDRQPHLVLNIWAYYNRHLIDFHARHRDRCLLVSTRAVLDRPEAFSQLLADKLGLDVPATLTADRVAELYRPELFGSLSDTHPLIASVHHRTPQHLRWLGDLERAADLPSARADDWHRSLARPPHRSIDLVSACQFPAIAPDTASLAPVASKNTAATTPAVSVVIPCYNQGEFILEAIASVQRCPQFDDLSGFGGSGGFGGSDDSDSGDSDPERHYEIVIVNDVSTDPMTIEVLNYLRSKGLNVIDRPVNGGLSAARNTGIENARGRYILPLDADNRIEPEYITRAIEVMDANPAIGVVYSDVRYIGDKTGTLEVPEFDINRLCIGNYIDACAVIRRELWKDCGGYDTQIPDRLGYEDWDLWLTAAAKGWKFHHEPQVLFDYRVRVDSMVSGCNIPENRQRLMHYFCAKHIDLYATNFADIFAHKDAELLAERNHTAQLERERNELQAELARQKAELDSLASDLHRTNLQLQTAQSQLLPLEAQHAADRVEIGDLRTELTATHAQLHSVSVEKEQLETECDGLRDEAEKLAWEGSQTRQVAIDTIGAMRTSKFWKLRDRWLKLREPLAQRLGKPMETDAVAVALARLGVAPNYLPVSALPPADVYESWRQQNEPTAADFDRMRRDWQQLKYQPTISIVVPVYDPDRDFLEAAIESVRSQTYPHWELCLADDCSSEPHVREVLERYRDLDKRITVAFREENGHISRASNSALDLATGDYIALLDHDDAIAPHALYEVVSYLNAHPDAAMVYTDEDKIDARDRRFDPFFKPGWCPDSFLSRMYTCHFGVYRREIVEAIGGFRVGFEGAQDYDFVLRFTEQVRDPSQIGHISKVLYHWRSHAQSTAQNLDSKDYAADAARKALEEAIDRRNEPGKMLPSGSGHWIARYEIVKPGRVTVIIPTRDLADVLEVCLRSIFTLTTYEDYEVLVVDNGSVEAKTRELFDRWTDKEPDRFRVVTYDAPFNYSSINNYAASQTTSPYLLLLNNDTEVIDGDWMTAMVEQAQRESIGAVGATLLYPDKTIQHAGVVLGIGGVAGHSHKTFPHGAGGYVAQLKTVNNYSAVTAACLMCRRDVFVEVGGLEPSLQIAFNDVDFCLKIVERGYRNVHLPHVVLYHYESKSRGLEDTPEKQMRFKSEVDYMRDRWGELLDNDPCYSPNLTRVTEDWAIQI